MSDQPSTLIDNAPWSQHDLMTPELKLAHGAGLPNALLHYQTAGTRVLDKNGRTTNAVMLLHGTTGSSSQFSQPGFANSMFRTGQPFDLRHWFVIAPDALGHGQSTKPSDGMYNNFPEYGYADMVEAQRHVLDDAGVERAALILGTSMGGMQVWLWGSRYPDRAKALVSIAAEPAPITGRNLLWRRIITDAIRNDDHWKGGGYDTLPVGYRSVWPLFDLIAGSPSLFGTIDSPSAALDYIKSVVETAPDATDMLFALEASADYDPTSELERVTAPTLAIGFATDEVNPPGCSTLDDLVTQMPNLQRVLLDEQTAPDGHRSLSRADLYADFIARFTSDLARVVG